MIQVKKHKNTHKLICKAVTLGFNHPNKFSNIDSVSAPKGGPQDFIVSYKH